LAATSLSSHLQQNLFSSQDLFDCHCQLANQVDIMPGKVQNMAPAAVAFSVRLEAAALLCQPKLLMVTTGYTGTG
jgi:hypothetical protein